MDPRQQARVDLAAILRWSARLGLNEGVDNHFSVLVPGTEDRGEGWWRWARQSWLWDDYLRSVFFPR